jgi:hypothetical protein
MLLFDQRRRSGKLQWRLRAWRYGFSHRHHGLSINFNTPVQIVGTQIKDNRIGDNFTAEVLAFSGNVLLGTFTENGFTGDVADNSAIFLGVEDATADITSVTYLTFTSNPFTLQDVNINQVTIESSQTPVPAALPLFATGLAEGASGRLNKRTDKHERAAERRHAKNGSSDRVFCVARSRHIITSPIHQIDKALRGTVIFLALTHSGRSVWNQKASRRQVL